MPGPSSNWEHLTFNRGPGGHPALKKKAVRQALAYGLDRVALIRDSPLGPAVPTLRPLNSVVFLPQSPYYRSNWSRYDHNPRLARQLLERAGCRRGADGIYVCDEQRLRLRLAARQGFVTPTRVVELVRDQLREIGVEIVLELRAPLVVTRQIIIEWQLRPGAIRVGLGLARSGRRARHLRLRSRGQLRGYCQRLVTRELDQARRILDARKQALVLNRADAQLARDVPIIPLYQTPFPARRHRERPQLRLSPFNPLATAEDWWLAR